MLLVLHLLGALAATPLRFQTLAARGHILSLSTPLGANQAAVGLRQNKSMVRGLEKEMPLSVHGDKLWASEHCRIPVVGFESIASMRDTRLFHGKPFKDCKHPDYRRVLGDHQQCMPIHCPHTSLVVKVYSLCDKCLKS